MFLEWLEWWSSNKSAIGLAHDFTIENMQFVLKAQLEPFSIRYPDSNLGGWAGMLDTHFSISGEGHEPH